MFPLTCKFCTRDTDDAMISDNLAAIMQLFDGTGSFTSKYIVSLEKHCLPRNCSPT